MNKKERTKVYFNFLKKRTALAKKKIDLSRYQPPPKKKEIFIDKAIAIRDTIRDGNFGCNTESVYNLAKTLTSWPLPPLEDIEHEHNFYLDPEHLQVVPWACYSTIEEEDNNKNCTDCYISFDEDEITFLSSGGNSDAGPGPWYFNPAKLSFIEIKFATDTQIKRLLKDTDCFKVIDNILGFLTEK